MCTNSGRKIEALVVSSIALTQLNTELHLHCIKDMGRGKEKVWVIDCNQKVQFQPFFKCFKIIPFSIKKNL